MEATLIAPLVSESLLRLQKIIVKLRWSLFVLALTAAAYVRQMGLADNGTLAKMFAIAGLIGVASALDEFLLRRAQRWPRLAQYGISLSDWVVASLLWLVAPDFFIQYPFIYFLPIVVANIFLGIPGGVLLGLLSSLALAGQTSYVLGAVALAKAIPWAAAFLITGGIGGYIGQQWESTQRHVEATYRWIAELSAATTTAEVAEVILRYLQSVMRITGASGPGAASRNGSVVALLTADDDGRCSAYAAKGISPEVRARLRVSTREGLLSWSAMEGKPFWVGLEEETSPITLPHSQELAEFRSCLVAPFRNEGKLLALGLAFSTKLAGQSETEVRDVSQFSEHAATSLRKAMIYSQMERQFSTLAAVLEKTRYGGQSDVKLVFQWVVARARELVVAETVALAIRDKQGNLVVVSTSGDGAEQLIARGDRNRVLPSDWVIDRKSPLIVTDYHNDSRFTPREEDLNTFRSAIFVPLRIQDEAFGLLAAGTSERSRFSQNDLVVFIMLGQQVSMVLQEARLQVEAEELREMLKKQTEEKRVPEVPIDLHTAQFTKLRSEVGTMMAKLQELWGEEGQQFKQASEREELYKGQAVTFAEELYKLYEVVQEQAKEISEARQELEQSQEATVLALAMGLERNYEFLAGSGERVAQLAVTIAHRLGCSPEDKRDLYYAGLLRDIGLMGVPSEVLLTPELDEEQRELVRQHPVIGNAIITSFPFLAGAAVLVHHHHERWDGGGYPDGLSGEGIPLGSRILAIADSYEALTSERSYRQPLAPREALEIILHNAGSQFDEEICDSFVSVFDERRDIASWVLPRLSQPQS